MSDRLMPALRVLLSAGLIRRAGASWELTDEGRRRRQTASNPQVPPTTPMPRESRPPAAPKVDTAGALEHEAPRPASAISSIRREVPKTPPGAAPSAQDGSPCGHMRRLIAYYIDCARLDERPSSVLYGSDYNRSFISLPLHAPWWADRPNQLVQVRLALRKVQSDFAKNMARAQADDLFVGYPLFVLPPAGDDRSALVVPIFCIPASAEPSETELKVTLDFEDADVNAEWCQKQFRTNEERRAFLKACALVDPDEDESDEIPTDFLKLPSAVAALEMFCGKGIVDARLRADWTKPIGDFIGIEKGIHNSAVLYVGKRLTYNAGLLIELRKMLASATDEDFQKTALWHVLGTGPLAPPANAAATVTISPPAPIVAQSAMEPIPFLPFNYEQEQALGVALNSQLAVITGPPGTGKSQVAANLLTNLAVNGFSGLFASRNHKALDAVVPRTNDIVGETILLRTKDQGTGQT
ncbi:MAG: hypothetical protein IMZ62_18645, partial [Chloroflexi bacterium]|nr:hypothetical protein [Chloroflexota bacterium]